MKGVVIDAVPRARHPRGEQQTRKGKTRVERGGEGGLSGRRLLIQAFQWVGLSSERDLGRETPREKKIMYSLTLIYPFFLVQEMSCCFFPVSFTLSVITEKTDLPSISRK